MAAGQAASETYPWWHLQDVVEEHRTLGPDIKPGNSSWLLVGQGPEAISYCMILTAFFPFLQELS